MTIFRAWSAAVAPVRLASIVRQKIDLPTLASAVRSRNAQARFLFHRLSFRSSFKRPRSALPTLLIAGEPRRATGKVPRRPFVTLRARIEYRLRGCILATRCVRAMLFTHLEGEGAGKSRVPIARLNPWSYPVLFVHGTHG
jgi:hypothetical protein